MLQIFAKSVQFFSKPCLESYELLGSRKFAVSIFVIVSMKVVSEDINVFGYTNLNKFCVSLARINVMFNNWVLYYEFVINLSNRRNDGNIRE